MCLALKKVEFVEHITGQCELFDSESYLKFVIEIDIIVFCTHFISVNRFQGLSILGRLLLSSKQI